MNKIEGPYKAAIPPGKVTGVVHVKSGDREVCSVEDMATAELIASALNLWEVGAEDDTLDQLSAAHQMNLALSRRCKQLQDEADKMKNRLPGDGGEDYGDNLIETANALLQKAGKAGSYTLSTFDHARIAEVKAERKREQRAGEDVVTVRSAITLRKKCIKSGEYDEGWPGISGGASKWGLRG